MTTYCIERFFRDREPSLRVRGMNGLTLEEVRAHCADPETSSSTATGREATARTRKYGPWFDGYTEE